MFTILAILGIIMVLFLAVGLVTFLLATCWWLGILVAVGMILGFIDWCVIKHGFKKLFGKKN